MRPLGSLRGLLSVARRCLVRAESVGKLWPGQRISDLDVLNTELAAWQDATDADQLQVEWQFTNEDARMKLRDRYPNQ